MAPSAVWQYFTKKGTREVSCNKCSKTLTYCGSTSTLFHHLKHVHQIDLPKMPPSGHAGKRSRSDLDVDDPPQQEQSAHSISHGRIGAGDSHTSAQASASHTDSTGASSSYRGPLEKCIDRASSFKRGGTRDAEATDALLFMIARDKMPLRTTESEGFRVFCKKLQPLYSLPSEPTVTKRLAEKREVLRDKVKGMFEKAESITITADIWTNAHTMDSYFGMTAHWTEGVEIKTCELTAKPITGRKTKENLQIVMREICQDWGIDYEKVRAVVTDGGSNIKAAVKEEFSPSKWIGCFAHQLNCVAVRAIGMYDSRPPPSERPDVAAPEPDLPDNESDIEDDDMERNAPDRDLLVVTDLRSLIKKVKKIVTFFRSSEIAASELKRLQQEEWRKKSNEILKLIQEVRTRWNSLFEMLERFLLLSDLVSRVLFKIQRERSSRWKAPDILKGEELETLTEVRDLLKSLAQCRMEISSEKTVTISKVIPLVNGMLDSIEAFLPTTPVGFNLKEKLLAELTGTFGNVEFVKIYASATLLDPRFKKIAFRNIRASAEAITYVGNMVRQKINESHRQQLTDAAEEDETPAALTSDNAGPSDLWRNLDKAVEASRLSHADEDSTAGHPLELRQYLNRPCSSRTETPNPLQEWETLKSSYPHVYQVAREVLPILATSVTCERLFSHAGLIANQLRSRLLSKRLDELVFLSSISEELWFS